MGLSLKFVFIEEIECVWFEMQCEMIELGKVIKFIIDVVEVGGEKVNKEVVCVGFFVLVFDGKYLEYNGVIGIVFEFICQFVDCYNDLVVEFQVLSGDLV